MEKSDKVPCTICNKLYSSRNSLYNHNKRFHESLCQKVNTKSIQGQYKVNTKSMQSQYNVNTMSIQENLYSITGEGIKRKEIKCPHCNKLFSSIKIKCP